MGRQGKGNFNEKETEILSCIDDVIEYCNLRGEVLDEMQKKYLEMRKEYSGRYEELLPILCENRFDLFGEDFVDFLFLMGLMSLEKLK